MTKCKIHRPEGTYILWLDLRDYNLSCDEIKQRIYHNARVICQGGTSYDEKACGQFQRLCIASPRTKVMESLERISVELNR